MWTVVVDGFKRDEFAHWCDAVDFVEALPGSEPETAKIVFVPKREESIFLRTGETKRHAYRLARRAKLKSRGAM